VIAKSRSKSCFLDFPLPFVLETDCLLMRAGGVPGFLGPSNWGKLLAISQQFIHFRTVQS